ncbi:MAG: hypothetical protein J7498_01935 [Sphingobium sp.]|nr:hypothetical protein [Sphingobium sp.]
MTAKTILNADMRTLANWAKVGVAWWLDELKEMVPRRLRPVRRDGFPHLYFNGSGLAAPGDAPIRTGLSAIIDLAADRCLVREIECPVLSDRDIQRMATFEVEALLPFAPGDVVATARVKGPSGPGKIIVEVAGMPASLAQALGQAVKEAGVVPMRVRAQGRGEDHPIDFGPALRDSGILEKPRSATPALWVLVAILAATNVAVSAWRDIAATDRLDALVQEQQPAVNIARVIKGRMAQNQGLVAQSMSLRRQHDALGILAATSTALPDGSWLQRYVWDGPTVRLTGYKPARTDAATALRRSQNFVDVRSMNDEVQAAVPAGEPFDIAARVRIR